ncbi:Dolichyl-diphosphooligosaccharide--protein glycosyltransferase subunit 2 [Capsicum baccatum]|uniref:Dolichyl-diphosphooligosaccharide--protein glycosyltransferase subunit 2 n=1 Tax=Capsicum baccatum TaxID=33114 RepID=A0A2G2WT55_CAPBA|nr:Dolichyl-diphosphooligosaccharide--protein glycosyltransferase subunit 2 [Capsicum baccatum]
MAEYFNAWVLGARHKTIITMLEEIRVKIMKRVGHMRDFCETWISDISPMSMKVLNDNTTRSMKCSIEWNSNIGYAVLDTGYRHIVDLARQYCSCRAWMLKGTPCPHAVASLHYKKLETINYLSLNISVMPPHVKKLPGRPRKNRKKEEGAPTAGTNENPSPSPSAGADPSAGPSAVPSIAPTIGKGRDSTGRRRGRPPKNSTEKCTDRPRMIGMGLLRTQSGCTILNPGMPSERFKTTKSSAFVTGNLRYTPKTSVKWNGKKIQVLVATVDRRSCGDSFPKIGIHSYWKNGETMYNLSPDKQGMTKVLGFLVLLALSSALTCEAAIFKPISHSHRSAALELFTPADGSFKSFEEAYEALRTFEVLGIKKQPDQRADTCASVVDTLSSPSSALKDLFQALRVNGLLNCELNKKAFAGIVPRLKDAVKSASSLLDSYYSVGSLVLIKGLSSDVDVHLESADSVFRAIKALGQSDGRWRYSSNNPESSTYAAGIAFESLAGVISLASSEIDQSLISMVKNDISKLLGGLEKYDDGAYYFDEKLVDAQGHQGPLSASSSVVCGITSFATVSAENLNLPGDKILGLARFFLGIGVPGNAKDLYYQVEALASLENNRVSMPLILSLPTNVLSLTRKDPLKV